MLSVQFYLFIVSDMPSGIFAVSVQMELDCLNDPTTQPVLSGNRKMGAKYGTTRPSANYIFCCRRNAICGEERPLLDNIGVVFAQPTVVQ